MPHIVIKTTQGLTFSQKENLASQLKDAFAHSSNQRVAGNIQFIIEDECFIQFRGSSHGTSASVEMHPGPLTAVDDYAEIVKAFFPVLVKELDTPQDRIYITISEVKYWGFNGELVNVDAYRKNL